MAARAQVKAAQAEVEARATRSFRCDRGAQGRPAHDVDVLDAQQELLNARLSQARPSTTVVAAYSLLSAVGKLDAGDARPQGRHLRSDPALLRRPRQVVGPALPTAADRLTLAHRWLPPSFRHRPD